MNDVHEGEIVPSQALAVRQSSALEETISTALEAQVRAGIEARYTLALRQPRDMDLVRLRILKECKRPGFAAVARYSKPQGGKKIEGPSIRFVETALRCMTNIANQSSVIYEDQTRRILRMSVTDVESNVTAEADITVNKTVERHNGKDREIIGTRQNKEGKMVYIVACTEDELLVKQNSLLSKAKRQLGLSLIPGDIVDEAQYFVVKTLRDEDAANPDAQRNKVFDAFAEIGITPPEIKEYLGREAGPADLNELRGLFQAIRQGDVMWRDVLEEKRQGDQGAATKTLEEKLKQKAATKKPDPAPQQSAPAATPPDLMHWEAAIAEATTAEELAAVLKRINAEVPRDAQGRDHLDRLYLSASQRLGR